jgi:hypothetical protein
MKVATAVSTTSFDYFQNNTGIGTGTNYFRFFIAKKLKLLITNTIIGILLKHVQSSFFLP